MSIIISGDTGVSLAANVSGTVAVANGGTGATTLSANNVLLGNGTSAVQVVAPGTSGNVLTSNGTTWASTTPASSAPTTAQVGTATAGLALGAIGSYGLMGNFSGTAVNSGATIAGSSIAYTDCVFATTGGAATGTWRCMGKTAASGTSAIVTLFLRIA